MCSTLSERNIWAGRRVAIAGGSRGLGLGLARCFHELGCRVAVLGRSEDALESVAREFNGERILTRSGDVSQVDASQRFVRAIVEAWGGIDVWIGNAGVSPVVAAATDTSLELWSQVIGVNLTGAFLGASLAATVMGVGGAIIFTGSVLGSRPRAGLSAYSASKAGLVGFAKALALELAPLGVRVNVVEPGWFGSDLTHVWMVSERLSEGILQHTAVSRWGVVDELVGAYMFLASPQASFVTGSVVTVDGGYLLR